MLVLGVAALAAGLGLGLPKLLSGDHDEYGRIAIPPGEGVIELPAGEVVVFYEEGRSIAIDDAILEPEVEWTIRPEGGGEPLALDGDGARESNVTEQRAWTDFESLDVPEAGPYVVEILDITTPGAEPAVTFGTSGVATGWLALVIAGVLAGSTLITLAFVTGRDEGGGDG